MDRGVKIAIGVTSGIILVGGIALLIYEMTKQKTTQGGGSVSYNPGYTPAPNYTPPPNVTKPGVTPDQVINWLQVAGQAVQNFMKESFPLHAGMKGPNVQAMQTALKNNFNQLNVSTSGLFDFKTATALKNIGYMNSIIGTISQQDYDNIIAGIKK